MTALTVSDLLLAPRLDPHQVEGLLGPYGFKDVRAADRNLQAVAGDPPERQMLAEVLEDLLGSVSRSANPDQALTYLERFSCSVLNKAHLFSYLKNSAQTMEILARSLGGSSYMAEILIRDPHHFYWVTDPQILDRPRRKREIQRELVRTLRLLADERQQFEYLRSVKRREMLHIGIRDVLRISTVEETLAALSVLAEVLISTAYWIAATALRREHAIPPNAFTGFTILAMGKLGGGELNFSSDVDLMYLYKSSHEEAAGMPAADYFRRLGQKITGGLNELTGEGYVYRVDLRLRPEGEAGNIADPLDGFERYYRTRMGTWERLALLKAWPVAGNRALGNTFLEMVQPFVYDAPFDKKALEDVRKMKRRIDQKIAASRRVGRNVKLGAGGIREIELIAQTFQVSHGGHIQGIHERNTLKALGTLRDHSVLTEDEWSKLAGAYIFLRDVENKLQMVNDAQTHSLPVEQEELMVCSRLLGYSTLELFERDYEYHTGQVNAIFEAVIGLDSPRVVRG